MDIFQNMDLCLFCGQTACYEAATGPCLRALRGLAAWRCAYEIVQLARAMVGSPDKIHDEGFDGFL
jgi:hypothetical protein